MLEVLPDLDPLLDLVADRPITVLAGAGCSTDSGMPDYGGLNSRTRQSRIQFNEFVEQPEARQRYWARAAIGWRRVRDAEPNAARRALARLEHGLGGGTTDNSRCQQRCSQKTTEGTLDLCVMSHLVGYGRKA